MNWPLIFYTKMEKGICYARKNEPVDKNILQKKANNIIIFGHFEAINKIL